MAAVRGDVPCLADRADANTRVLVTLARSLCARVPVESRYHVDVPIADVKWPPGLLRLSFGGPFDQPVEDARWPPSLQCLWMGQKFNQPVEGVTWPASLRQLRFGHRFNQPVEGVDWPDSLQVRG